MGLRSVAFGVSIAALTLCFSTASSAADKAGAPPDAGVAKKTAPAKGATDAPRPPPFASDLPPSTLPPKRRLDVGVEAMLVNRFAADHIEGVPSHIAYKPAAGFEFHARIQVIRYLQMGAYFCGSAHTIKLGRGALGVQGSIDSDDLSTISFGAKVMPTLPLGQRVRLWGTLGVGWGRFEFPQMTAHEHGRAPFLIKGRGNSFVEFPIGIGSSFELVKNWLSLDLEIIGAPMAHNDGTSFVNLQALDNGHERVIEPMPKSHLSFSQAIGLSLLL